MYVAAVESEPEAERAVRVGLGGPACLSQISLHNTAKHTWREL